MSLTKIDKVDMGDGMASMTCGPGHASVAMGLVLGNLPAEEITSTEPARSVQPDKAYAQLYIIIFVRRKIDATLNFKNARKIPQAVGQVLNT